MRGLWRPLLAYGSIPVVMAAFFAWRDGTAWSVLVALPLAVAPLVVLVSVLGPVHAGRFLRGLRDAGEVVEVERDEVDWVGERTLVVRGATGRWRIVGVGGKAPHVRVLGPGDAFPWRVEGNERRAAREAVDRAAVGARAEPPPKIVTPRRLAVYTAVLYGLVVALGFVFGGPRGAAWTAAVAAPFFAWLGWRIVRRRGKPMLQHASGRIES